MSGSENELSGIISREIMEKGPLSFSRYMELCLYHPEHGYYQRADPATGREGDFFTAPHVHALFGRAVGSWIHRRAVEMGWEPFTVMELGAGAGHLAGDILGGWKPPPDLSMVLVEESAARRSDLEKSFRGGAAAVLPPGRLEALLPVKGAIIANEFFDALPFEIFTRSDGRLYRVAVTCLKDRFEEVLVPVEGGLEDPLGGVLSLLPEGHRTEVSPLWRDWLIRCGKILERGCLLILDYGEVTETLLAPWRQRGTLRCYRRHEVDTDPYEDPGGKDITAHVNFSLLRDLAEEAGFAVVSFTTQISFLIKAGILDLLAGEMDRLPEREASDLWLKVKNLVHEEGMGEVFKAMVLEKNGTGVTP